MKLNRILFSLFMLCITSFYCDAQEVTTLKQVNEKAQQNEQKKKELVKELANPAPPDNALAKKIAL